MALQNKTTKIVDAESEPVNETSAVVDTSGLAKALQTIINANMPAQTATINPAKVINDVSARMLELYEAYEKLRIIGKQLNGRLVTDPIPESLKIENIQITFRTVDDGKQSEPVTANIKYISNVGEISNLISTELGAIILFLQQESGTVLDIITRTKEQVEKARKAWEEANKDKRIQEFTPEETTQPELAPAP